MIFRRARVFTACSVLVMGSLAVSSLAAAEAKDPLAPGSRSGPFVVTTRSLGELAGDGYEIRGNLGTALVLQKGASIFTCSIPPDPEHLSYRAYFVCSELREERAETASALPAALPALAEPRLKMDMPHE
ncbi:MAG: hypothetical protein K8R18_09825 [Parvibaculum sp.]|uniref:hypothetical protein n=1 Tax=Parvibaculum sp. TaxID=2024848 RepID=UPI0025CCEBEF|nr:hypothetical protein [Parvibaculum sp.]MCE9649907.1 hypothetical protein [Parvibaculum sp.]